MSLPPLSVTLVQEPEYEPHVPFERFATSRCTWLDPDASPEPESEPLFNVTVTDRLV